MAFKSVDISGRPLDKDLVAHLSPAQHKFLDDYTHKLAGVLIGEKELADAIDNAAKEIAEDYQQRGIDTIVGVYVLDGAMTVYRELQKSLFKYGMRMIDDNTKATRYGADVDGGVVRFMLDVKNVSPGDNVLIVEDIFDEGITFDNISKRVGMITLPDNIRLFSLLFKPNKYQGRLRIDYPVFKIDDHWIAGFGMDLSAKVNEGDKKLRPFHRDLPFVCASNPDYLLGLGIINQGHAEYLKRLITYK